MHIQFLQIIVFFFCFQICYGQKLPDIQQNAFLAPSDVKADGKNQEWNGTFQAHNKRTGLQYTMANDQDNLYLVIRSTDAMVSNKIVAGGIEFTINKEGKKKDKEGFKIIYPLVQRAGSRQSSSRSFSRISGSSQRAEQSSKQRDSVMLAMRRAQLAQVKEINLHGFAIPDTLISIYNEYRIKAFSSFDDQGAFFYELAIPLKLMGLSTQSAVEFAYNIKLRGLQMNFSRSGGGGGSERQPVTFRSGGGSFGGGSSSDFQSLMSPTDFWGNYKLTK